MPAKSIHVNGQSITDEEIRAAAARRREQAEKEGRILTPEERLRVRQETIESLIDRTLLVQEARRLNFTPAEQNQDALIRDIIEHWSGEVPRPAVSEVRAFYRKRRELFWTPELAWAAHIVKHTEGANCPEKRAEVEQLRERVLRGELFGEVAAQDSDCPENGGDLGYFGRGTMVEEFDEIIFAAPLNTLTPVFQTRFGYHIAIVYDRKPEGVRPLDEIQAEVERLLYLQKQDEHVERCLAALRKKAVIEQA